MELLDYQTLYQEILQQLESLEAIVLATCAAEKVTARTMCPVNEGLQIFFGTNASSEKAVQMRRQPHIALAAGNMQIEAIARLLGHPDSQAAFKKRYVEKYPQFGDLYPTTPDSLVVAAYPSVIKLYKYKGGPCEEVLDVSGQKAYRNRF